jgi:fumarate reductase (CoM/CoB) subunit B
MENMDKCCGAGGGVRASQKDLSYKIRKEKLEAINESKADIVLAACPFCELHIDEGLREEVKSGTRAITPQSFIAMMFKDIGEEVAKL